MGRKPKQETECKKNLNTKAKVNVVENIKLDNCGDEGKQPVVKIKKKRGRKPKSKTEVTNTSPKIPKKRGRKPKGGKIIKNITSNHIEHNIKPNVILHLKCSLSDIEPKQMISNLDYNPNNVNTTIEPYNNDNMNLYIINEMNLKTSDNESSSLVSEPVHVESTHKEKKNSILTKNRSRSNSTVSIKEEHIYIKDIWKKLKN